MLYALGDMSELAERRAAAEPAAFSQACALVTDDAAAAGAGVVSGVIDDGWLFLRREAAPELAARVPDLAGDIVSRLFVEAVAPLSDAGPRASLASVLGGLFSLALVAIMGRYMMTMTGLGRSIGEALYVDEIETRFADVAGAGEAVRDLGELARMIRGELSYGALGARTPKGVLLVGPPGTGKTLLARATAGEARVNFIACAGSDFGGMLVGQGARDVGQLVARARRMAPCIVFIDEIDAVGKARGKVSHTDYETTLTKLLAEMDGVTAAGGVYFLAATNHAAALDPALVRPGRFDRVIRVPLPDLAAREKLLALHARGLALAPDAALGDIARLAHGFSGAQLAALANEAAIQAGRAGASAVAREHFERALMKLSIGERVEGAPLAPADRRLVAYHEAGHAVLALSDPAAPPVDRVTIVPHGEALGHVATRPRGHDDRAPRLLPAALRWLDALGDAALTGRLLRAVAWHGDIVAEDAAPIVAALKPLAASDRPVVLDALARGAIRLRPEATAALLAQAAAEPELVGAGALDVGVVDLTALLSRAASDELALRMVKPAALADLLTAAAALSTATVAALCDALLAAPELYHPDRILLPLARELARRARSPAPPLRLRTALLDHLGARVDAPLAPPSDWTRTARLGCDCPDCRSVSAFLAAPDTAELAVRAAQERRTHVERICRGAQADLDYATIKAGSPHQLILRKTDASYRRRVAQRQQDLDDRAMFSAEPPASAP